MAALDALARAAAAGGVVGRCGRLAGASLLPPVVALAALDALARAGQRVAPLSESVASSYTMNRQRQTNFESSLKLPYFEVRRLSIIAVVVLGVSRSVVLRENYINSLGVPHEI
ncbi:hypothetical protein [Massilia sp. Root351]|jgi:hypothetical protein|uniref:hypothetical protein n=1 Tax=Massilia sp. Root351 TaxID=1736522 RepID=UPI0012F69E98|nr:hypothetical protein [Massilia sp. Root351]